MVSHPQREATTWMNCTGRNKKRTLDTIGPPGTGKTYVGLKIVQTLLGNLYNVGPCKERRRKRYTPEMLEPVSNDMPEPPTILSQLQPTLLEQPILVVCYTNHTLDQFLEGILHFLDKHGSLIRVGSRSRSEKLEEFNLHKIIRTNSELDYRLRGWLRTLKAEKMRILHDFKRLDVVLKNLQSGQLVYDFSNLYTDRLLEYFSETNLWEWLHDAGFENSEYHVEKFQIWRAKLMKSVQNSSSAALAKGTDSETLLEEGKIEDEDDETDKRLIEGLDDETAGTAVMLDKSFYGIDWSIGGRSVMSESQVVDLLNDAAAKNSPAVVLWNMPLTERWRLYKYWYCQALKTFHSCMSDCQEEFKKNLCLERNVRQQAELKLLSKAKVIGMTTTGAARMQSVLQQVGPEIVIVEEAAEVLEAHIITALSKHCKHLILIGDHKQLQPNPTVYDLAKNYNLDLSLFERMVNNGLPVKTLNIQHRMRPEVSKYIRGHIYDRLDDHPTMFEREAIRGVAQPVFFFNHDKEESEMAGLRSKCNEFEAEMIVKFTSYLMRQNYKCTQISVITMYKGQELDIRKRIRQQGNFEGLKVCTVDNYQGEENDIIIISLVRSNKDDKLGFIEKDNRVCVTLSRAKLGVYVFGNFDMIGKKSKLWAELITKAKQAGEYGEEINLSCVLHKSPATASKPEDFYTKAPLGGCTKPCNEMMKCGHTCPQQCHYTDRGHMTVMCRKPCIAKCVRGHPCKGKVCGSCQHVCTEPRTERLSCYHFITAPCHKWDLSSPPPCDKICEEALDCGHQCKSLCRDGCPPCEELVEKMCSKCDEISSYPCHSTTFRCRTPCNIIFDCGHKCSGNCWDCRKGFNPVHQKCRVKCEKYLPCGHKCKGLCGDCDPKCRDSCTQKCLLRCSHGNRCRTTCAEVCKFEKRNSRCSWGCMRHSRCTNSCDSPCSYKVCTERCEMEVECTVCKQSSRCQGLCGQPHPPTCKTCQLPEIVEQLKKQLSHEPKDTDLWLLLSDCNHSIPVRYMDEWVETNKHSLPILCPYTNCKQPVLNTGMYVNITRRDKHKTDKERQLSAPDCSMAADRMERSSRRRSRSPSKSHDSGRRSSRRRSRSPNRRRDRGRKESRSKRESRHHSSVHKHSDNTRKRERHTSADKNKRSQSLLDRIKGEKLQTTFQTAGSTGHSDEGHRTYYSSKWERGMSEGRTTNTDSEETHATAREREAKR